MQRSIFGAGHIDAMREAAPENQKHIQQYLSDNCFGDFPDPRGTGREDARDW